MFSLTPTFGKELFEQIWQEGRLNPRWKVKQVRPPVAMTGSCWCTAGKGIKTKQNNKRRDQDLLELWLAESWHGSRDPAGIEQVACTEGGLRSLSEESLDCDSIEKIIYS